MSCKQFINIEVLEGSENSTLEVNFEKIIDGLGCVEPVKADLKIKSLGEIIEITGSVKGKFTFLCDLCLEEFEQDLDFKIHEFFTKNTLFEEYSQETELTDDMFVTDLSGAEEIDIYDLLYQSVILNFPNKKVCGINCKGKEFLKEEISDPRMDVFRNIKIETKNN